MPNNQEQLDPKIVKVLRAIRTIESDGDYNAIGDNGTSAGAFQWNNGKTKLAAGQVPANFQRDAREVGGDINDFSKANQNKVAYYKIKKLKDEGKTPEEIAALWNGAKKGQDGRYTYINPLYGERFRSALQGQGGTTQPAQQTGIGGSYPAPPQIQAETAPDASSGGHTEQKSLLQKGAEFLFPILEQKERTPLQFVGDIGMSALTLVPGLGAAGLAAKGAKAASGLAKGAKVAQEATKGAGLLSKSNIAKGAGIGYSADVLSSLSQGETDLGSIVTPGLGTAVGAGGGAAVTGLKKLAPNILSRTSGVPQAALEYSSTKAPLIKGIIKAGTTPKDTRNIAVTAVKDLRKTMTTDWQKGVDDLVKTYDKQRVGLPEGIAAEFKDIASRYNTSTKTRIAVPNNLSSMSVKELTDTIKDLNGIKYNPLQPDIALKDMKAYLKNLGKTSFNAKDEFSKLYSNYATKSDILEAADDIVRAFKSKKPTQVTTAINRLQSIFNDGKEEYLYAIQALEKETGADILSHIAANKVAPRMPRDLKAGLQLDDLLQWLGVLVTSPRAAAELNRIISGTSTGKIGKFLTGTATRAPLVPGLLETSSPQSTPQQ